MRPNLSVNNCVEYESVDSENLTIQKEKTKEI